MSIDIDRGFKKVSELRFYEINNTFCEQVLESTQRKRKPKAKKQRNRVYKTKRDQDKALEIMKNDLINGLACKVAAIDSGYKSTGAAQLFKRRTGKTMKQFREENRNKPQ